MGLPRIVVSALLHASIAQLVEHRSRKAGVIGSNPIAGSSLDHRSEVIFSLAYFIIYTPSFQQIG